MAKAAIKEAQVALAALPRGEAAVHYEAGERLVGICDIWNEMTPDEKHELVMMVLARIEVNVEAGAVEAVIPKPAFAPLFRYSACYQRRGAGFSVFAGGDPDRAQSPHVTAIAEIIAAGAVLAPAAHATT